MSKERFERCMDIGMSLHERNKDAVESCVPAVEIVMLFRGDSHCFDRSSLFRALFRRRGIVVEQDRSLKCYSRKRRN